MSFYTALEIAYTGDWEPPDIDTVSEKILHLLDSDGIHHDVLQNIRVAFDTGKADFFVHAAYLAQLIQSISEFFPNCSFEARGLGEEFRNTWVRSFEDGKLIFEVGPWDYD